MQKCAEGLAWLKFVLSSGKQSQPKIQDWNKVYEFAFKHSLIGVCNPFIFDVRLPQNLLFQWMGDVEQLKSTNRQLNKGVVEISEFFCKAGFRCCILKGQGNALMYPDPLLRCPGDIDVWVDADRATLYSFVKNQYPKAKAGVKHISFELATNVEIEAHYTPQKLFYPAHNRRLNKWLENQKETQFNHLVKLPENNAEIAIPTVQFNAVYLLGHILMHLLEEGIGLRQFVDYYYVLRECENLSEEEKNDIKNTWKRVGTLGLASGVMWIEKELLGLPESCLLVKPNKCFGLFIAEDILEGGNFGRHSKWSAFRQKGRIANNVADIWRYIRLMRFMPKEVIFRVLFKLRTAVRVLNNTLYSVRKENDV